MAPSRWKRSSRSTACCKPDLHNNLHNFKAFCVIARIFLISPFRTPLLIRRLASATTYSDSISVLEQSPLSAFILSLLLTEPRPLSLFSVSQHLREENPHLFESLPAWLPGSWTWVGFYPWAVGRGGRCQRLAGPPASARALSLYFRHLSILLCSALNTCFCLGQHGV